MHTITCYNLCVKICVLCFIFYGLVRLFLVRNCYYILIRVNTYLSMPVDHRPWVSIKWKWKSLTHIRICEDNKFRKQRFICHLRSTFISHCILLVGHNELLYLLLLTKFNKICFHFWKLGSKWHFCSEIVLLLLLWDANFLIIVPCNMC